MSSPQDRTNRSARSKRADYRAFVPITTRWADNDRYGHLNNMVYYSFFDTAVTNWLFQSGLAADGHNRMFFVAETGCRYLAEIAYPDKVTVGLRIAHLGTSSIRYDLAIFRNEEDEVSAEGLFVHVNIDPAARRPAPIDDALREKLRELVA